MNFMCIEEEQASTLCIMKATLKPGAGVRGRGCICLALFHSYQRERGRTQEVEWKL